MSKRNDLPIMGRKSLHHLTTGFPFYCEPRRGAKAALASKSVQTGGFDHRTVEGPFQEQLPRSLEKGVGCLDTGP